MRPCNIESLDGRLLRFFGLFVGFLLLDEWLLFGVLLVGLLLADLLDLLLADLLNWLLLYRMLVDLLLHRLLVEILLWELIVDMLLHRLLVDLMLRGLLVELLLCGLLVSFHDWLLVYLLLLGWISMDLPLVLSRSVQNGSGVLIEWLLSVGKLLLVGLVSYMLLRSIAAGRLLHSKRATSARHHHALVTQTTEASSPSINESCSVLR